MSDTECKQRQSFGSGQQTIPRDAVEWLLAEKAKQDRPWWHRAISRLDKTGFSPYPYLLAAVLVFWVRGGNFDALWMQRWCVILVALSAVLAYRIGSAYSWGFAPFVFTTLFSGIVPAFWFQRYDNAFMERIAAGVTKLAEFSSDDKWAMQAVARQDTSRAVFVFLLMLYVMRSFSLPTLKHFRLALGGCGMLFAVLVLCTPHADYWVPFFDNPSMGACFIVLSLFALDTFLTKQLFTPWRVAIWAVGISAVLVTKTSAPLLGLAVGGAGFAYASAGKWTWKWWHLALVFCIPLAVGGVGYFFQGAELWNNNSRLSMWSWYTAFWARIGKLDWFTYYFGLGLGSTRTFLPLAEVEHGMDTGWFFWLHNDWLQVLVEQGVAGFMALLLAAGTLLHRARNHPQGFAFLFAFGAIMLVNFPLHWPVHALLLAAAVAPTTTILKELVEDAD